MELLNLVEYEMLKFRPSMLDFVSPENVGRFMKALSIPCQMEYQALKIVALPFLKKCHSHCVPKVLVCHFVCVTRACIYCYGRERAHPKNCLRRRLDVFIRQRQASRSPAHPPPLRLIGGHIACPAPSYSLARLEVPVSAAASQSLLSPLLHSYALAGGSNPSSAPGTCTSGWRSWHRSGRPCGEGHPLCHCPRYAEGNF